MVCGCSAPFFGREGSENQIGEARRVESIPFNNRKILKKNRKKLIAPVDRACYNKT